MKQKYLGSNLEGRHSTNVCRTNGAPRKFHVDFKRLKKLIYLMGVRLRDIKFQFSKHRCVFLKITHLLRSIHRNKKLITRLSEGLCINYNLYTFLKSHKQVWLVWLSGLSAGCEPKGRHFDSQSGHMPGLQARTPVGGA